MKTLIVILTLFFALSAQAAPIVIDKFGNLQITIIKTGAASFNDASPFWQVTDYPKFQVSGGLPGTPATLSFPTTITMTRQGGSETMQVTLVCRYSNVYTDKNGGSACTATTYPNDPAYSHISLVPVTAIFSNPLIGGTYSTNNITISIN